ncbi:MAG: uracil-DNA glycosylase [Endozoicomonadaceae bacterium]|nr:uracil-DNA glycosylase [Endozoicomonadaceae bacterium]
MSSITLEASWKAHLMDEFDKDYMRMLKAFLLSEKRRGKVIYPMGKEYFHALDLTPFDQVRVVIIGQDPYHGGQAHGLCFSVRHGVKAPPSLVNIYKEMQHDLNILPAKHGCLEHWAQQGVLLLNSVLTVEHKQAASHHKKGWEQFTDRIIRELNAQRSHLAFILWGSYAQKKGAMIDQQRHLVIKSAHPSPLSAYRGFFGSRPFSKINQYMNANKLASIEWQLPD